MILWPLVLLFTLFGLPVVLVLLSGRIALLAQSLADRRRDGSSAYLVAEMLEATFEPKPEGVWPPSPTIDPPVVLWRDLYAGKPPHRRE